MEYQKCTNRGYTDMVHPYTKRNGFLMKAGAYDKSDVKEFLAKIKSMKNNQTATLDAIVKPLRAQQN